MIRALLSGDDDVDVCARSVFPLSPSAFDVFRFPEQKKHLLPWPIGKIEAMEEMGASRAEDEVAWERIAAAVGSSVSEAVDQ